MAKNRVSKRLQFVKAASKTKTDVYRIFPVETSEPEELLGEIRWYAPWRRYTFQPMTRGLFQAFQRTVWDSGCLQEVTRKIDELMADWKQDKAKHDKTT